MIISKSVKSQFVIKLMEEWDWKYIINCKDYTTNSCVSEGVSLNIHQNP